MCDKNNNKIPCGCEEPEFCGCDLKIDLNCTYYQGDTLDTLAIKSGMTGEEIVVILNNYLKNILQNLDVSPTIIDNVGGGTVLYKGLSEEYVDEFKTLLEGKGIKITTDENTVAFSVDQDWLEVNILNLIQENTNSTTLDFKFSSSDDPGNPDTNPIDWKTDPIPSDKWMAIQEILNGEEATWKVVKIKGADGINGINGINGTNGTNGGPGVTGPTVFTSNAFIRSETQPLTPTGGTFASPVPVDWSNTIPPISSVNLGPVWTSTRIFTSNGLTPQQSSWTTPVKVADSETIDYEFSSFAGTSPGTPTTPLNGATWHNIGLENDRWMAVRTVKNGVNGVWSVVKIKGENGTNGQAGTGFSVVISNPIQSVAVGSDNTTSSELNYSVTIDVYSNSTQLSPMNSPLTESGYRIEVPTSPLTGIQVTKLNGNTLNYKITSGTVFNSQAITSMINVYAGLSETNLKTSFVIFPVNTAEDAESLTLSVDSNVIRFDGFGNLDTPTTVIARAQQQNYNETITWSSVPAGIVSGTGSTKTINSALFFQDSSNSAKIRIETPNGLFDETTIVKVQNGSGGAPGINGTTGPIPRLLELVVGGEYENGGEYIDYAYYRSNDTNEGWYSVNVVDDVRTVVTYIGGIPSAPTFTKAPFTKEMSFGTVIAEQANLAGFIFRNQKLDSQAVGTMNCSGTITQHPNLELDGRQGIIKFLDRMVMDKTGIVLKDDCGRRRMRFQWDESGVPKLEFLDENGNIIWSAGQGGYIYVSTGTRPSTWGNIVSLVKIDALNGQGSDIPTELVTGIGELVHSGANRNNVSIEAQTKLYNTSQISCSGPATASTPYRAVYDLNAFSTALTVRSYKKGDMTADINNYDAYYMGSTPVKISEVAAAPVGTFAPDGWYFMEGITGNNRNNSIICSATQGVYRFFEKFTVDNSPGSTVEGYYIADYVYMEKGNIKKTVSLVEERSWTRE